MIGKVVKLAQFYFTGEIKSCEFGSNITCEIELVKLGVFSFSPIAPICEAVKLGGDIYRRYIPQVHNFTRCDGRGWEASLFFTTHRFTKGGVL